MEVAAVFDALADPTRRQIVQLLGEGPRRAGELASAVATSAPAVSRHLRVLLEAGIVADERPRDDARVRMFRLRPESMVALQSWLDQLPGSLERAAEVVPATRRKEDQGMTTGRSVGAEVDVAVDAETAFMAFTDEMDLWWVRGPINFYDAARAVARRCEPGVGGRLLEVYDDATGDALELGRITVWEPGEHLAWQSSVDDVYIDVLFQPNDQGTTVRVEAHVPPEGSDRGGTSWVRVGPWWFGAWCARRETAPREPAELGRLALALYYARPATAARWLADVFGFETPDQLPDDDDARAWIEFRVGNSSLMVFKLEGESPDRIPTSHMPWVYVDDLDAHFATAKGKGATIVEGIHQHGYRAYVAEDLEGHRWTFAQARPTMR